MDSNPATTYYADGPIRQIIKFHACQNRAKARYQLYSSWHRLDFAVTEETGKWRSFKKSEGLSQDEKNRITVILDHMSFNSGINTGACWRATT